MNLITAAIAVALSGCTTSPPARLTVTAPTVAGRGRTSRPAETWWEPPVEDWSDWTRSGCLHGREAPEGARTGGSFAVVELTPSAILWGGEPVVPLIAGQLREEDLQGQLLPSLYEVAERSIQHRERARREYPCLSINPEAVLLSRSTGVPFASERAVLYTLGQAVADVEWLAGEPAGSAAPRSWALEEAVPLTPSLLPRIGPPSGRLLPDLGPGTPTGGKELVVELPPAAP